MTLKKRTLLLMKICKIVGLLMVVVVVLQSGTPSSHLNKEATRVGEADFDANY
jgi:hypothetical protein